SIRLLYLYGRLLSQKYNFLHDRTKKVNDVNFSASSLDNYVLSALFKRKRYKNISITSLSTVIHCYAEDIRLGWVFRKENQMQGNLTSTQGIFQLFILE